MKHFPYTLQLFILAVVSTLQTFAQTPSSYRVSFVVASGKPYVQIIAPSGTGLIKSVVGLPGSGQTYTYSNVINFWAVEGTAVGTGSTLQFTPNGRFWNAVPIFSGQPLPGVTEPAGDASGGTWNTPGGQPVDPGTGQPKVTPGTPGAPGTPNNPILPGVPGSGSPGNPGGGDSGGGDGSQGTLTGPRYKATGIVKNTYPGPMYFQIYLQSNGGTSRNWSTKTLQPGEATMIVLNEPFPFTWWAVPVLDMVEQDTEIPLPDPDPPVNDDPTTPGETPPYVPPLDTPASPATGDVYGAVMRAAEIARTYGEQARQGTANTNRLLQDIKDKPGGTDGGGMEGPGDVAGGDGGDGDELEEGDASAAEGLGEAVTQLGEGLVDLARTFAAPSGDSTLSWGIPNILGGPDIVISLEPYNAWFPAIRGAILLMMSIWFAFELISTVRGALA